MTKDTSVNLAERRKLAFIMPSGSPIKLRITYMSHRGAPGAENFYPQSDYLTTWESIGEFTAKLQAEGFWPDTSRFIDPAKERWVSPSAIIEVVEL